MVVEAAQSNIRAKSDLSLDHLRQPQDALDAVRAGDPAACQAFVEEHLPRMMGVARRFFRCEHECADVAQDALVSVVRSLHSFEGDANVSTWLHRIVVNACLMRIRARSRRTQVSIDNLLPAFDDAGNHIHPVSRWSDEPVHAAGRHELRDYVRKCIDQLPDGYREVLILRDMEQLDTEETARILGISVANVKVRLHRARQAIRTLLDPYMASIHSGEVTQVACGLVNGVEDAPSSGAGCL